MRTVVTSTHSSLRRAVVLALLGIAILFGDPVLSPASVGAVTLVWSPSPDPVVDYNEIVLRRQDLRPPLQTRSDKPPGRRIRTRVFPPPVPTTIL